MNHSTRLPSHGIYTAIVIIAFFTSGCHYLHHEEKQDIQYIPLNDYQYKHTKVDAGTPMRVIAFSGGKVNDQNNIYYCQFITINSSNGDTVRVLANTISFDDIPNSSATIGEALAPSYDEQKEITDAVFVPEDTSFTLIMSSPVTAKDEKDYPRDIGRNDLNKIKRPKLVAINKSQPMLQTPSYKTVIGMLHFKERPW